jgi:hypothetical protein
MYEFYKKEFNNWSGKEIMEDAFNAAKTKDLEKFRMIKKAFEFALILVEADKKRDEEEIKLHKKHGTTLVIERFGRRKKYYLS